MRVHGEVGGRVADLVLRVLGIVAAEEGPGALPVLAVDVLDPGRALSSARTITPGLSGPPGTKL